MHTKTKGTIAELHVAAAIVENGWKILKPEGENNRFDLVAYNKGKYIRIQVKYCTPKEGSLRVNCRSSNNWSSLSYTSDEIDVIAAFNPENKLVYFIPVTEINGSLFNLRVSPTKNNQNRKIHKASDYTDFNFKLSNFIKESLREYVTR